jgi:ABC-type molybdate transport system ATPase subunit
MSIEQRVGVIEQILSSIIFTDATTKQIRLKVHRIDIVDHNDHPRLTIKTDQDGTNIAIIDNKGNTGMDIFLNSNATGIQLSDSNNRQRCSVILLGNQPIVALTDDNNNTRISLSVNTATGGTIKIKNHQREAIWTAP